VTRVLVLPSPLLPSVAYEPLAEALVRRLSSEDPGVPAVGVARVRPSPISAEEVLADLGRAVEEVRPDLLVTHSNAGRYAAVAAPGVPVVHVDAALPPEDGVPATMAPEAMLDRLAAMADEDGRLPPWSRWWPAESLADVLPDAAIRAALQEQEHALPLSYFRSRLGAPAGWAGAPQAFLAFDDTYAHEVALARRHGWPVEVLAGAGHLHHLVAPDDVAAIVVGLAATLPRDPGPRGMLPA